jgi:hypothetical protein
MSVDEYIYWNAYFALHPSLEQRLDISTGIISSTIANAMGNKTKPQDFIPEYKQEPTEKLDSKQLSNKIKSKFKKATKSRQSDK